MNSLPDDFFFHFLTFLIPIRSFHIFIVSWNMYIKENAGIYQRECEKNQRESLKAELCVCQALSKREVPKTLQIRENCFLRAWKLYRKINLTFHGHRESFELRGKCTRTRALSFWTLLEKVILNNRYTSGIDDGRLRVLPQPKTGIMRFTNCFNSD